MKIPTLELLEVAADLRLAGGGVGDVVESGVEDVEEVLDEPTGEGLAHQAVVIVTKHPVECLAHHNKQVLP